MATATTELYPYRPPLSPPAALPSCGAEAEADGLTLADRHSPELDVLERVPEGDLLRAVVAHQLGHQCLRGDLAGAKQGVLVGVGSESQQAVADQQIGRAHV